MSESYIPGNVYVNDTYLSNIADAIRAKNGLSETYRPIEMGYAIDKINLVGDVTADMIATRSFSSNIGGNASIIKQYAFAYCSSAIKKADFPNCSFIDIHAFANCWDLEFVSFPNCVEVGSYAFSNCWSLSNASFSNCTSVDYFAFVSCSHLTNASFPKCTSIGSSAFAYCYSLSTIYFPSCAYMGSNAFLRCSSLTTADFSSCSYIGNSAFAYCESLATVNLPKCTIIGSSAFRGCYRLLSLYINMVSVTTTLGASAFYSTPIGGYTTFTGGVYGSVFVPRGLYSSFITATNWAAISSRIVSV